MDVRIFVDGIILGVCLTIGIFIVVQLAIFLNND